MRKPINQNGCEFFRAVKSRKMGQNMFDGGFGRKIVFMWIWGNVLKIFLRHSIFLKTFRS